MKPKQENAAKTEGVPFVARRPTKNECQNIANRMMAEYPDCAELFARAKANGHRWNPNKVELQPGVSVRLLTGEPSDPTTITQWQRGPLKGKKFIMFVAPLGLSQRKLRRLFDAGIRQVRGAVGAWDSDGLEKALANSRGELTPELAIEGLRLSANAKTVRQMQKQGALAGRGPKKGPRPDTLQRLRWAEKEYKFIARHGGGHSYCTHASRCEAVADRARQAKAWPVSGKTMQKILRHLAPKPSEKRR